MYDFYEFCPDPESKYAECRDDICSICGNSVSPVRYVPSHDMCFDCAPKSAVHMRQKELKPKRLPSIKGISFFERERLIAKALGDCK